MTKTKYEVISHNEMLTNELRANLKNCIGRATVEVINCYYQGRYCNAVYHYNALIAIYDNECNAIYCNRWFYAYSASTSRVRNEFIRLFSFYNSVPSTKQLEKTANSDSWLNHRNIDYKVLDIERERRYWF